MLLPIGTSAEANLFSFKRNCSTKEYSTKKLMRISKPGVVMISTNQARGSGFVVRHIKNQTLILTNSHVIRGANQITVEWPDGNQDSAVVVSDGGARTIVTDLALLKVDGKVGTVLPLKQDEAIVGGDVIAIGTPKGLSFTLTKGVISSLRDKGKIVQTDTAINPGSSGGPLINSSGCVVGVNTLGLKDDVGLNFAISSKTARRFIDKYTNDDFASKSSANNSFEASEYYNQGDEKSELEDYSGAIRDYTKAIKIDPKYARAYFKRGMAKYELEDYSGAIRDYTKAIKISPKDASLPDFYNNRGNSKKALEDYSGAIADYTKAIKIDPKYVFLSAFYYNRGNSKKALKDYSGAIADFTKAIELDPKYAWSYNSRGISKRALEDFSGAIADFTKAIEFNPMDSDLYRNRGLVKDDLEDYLGAIADFTKAIELNNYDGTYKGRGKSIGLGRTISNRGNAYEKIGDMKSACSDWKEAFVLNDEYAALRLADTDCRFVLGTPFPKNYDGECAHLRNETVTNETDYLACLSRFENSYTITGFYLVQQIISLVVPLIFAVGILRLCWLSRSGPL